MITANERKLILILVRLRLWKLHYGLFRCLEVQPCWGTYWLFKWLRKRQVVDNYHHAPGCPANHWHKMRLVFHMCTCGADIRCNQSIVQEGK